MPKDIVFYIATGIVVLGSVFGFSHLKKLSIRIRQFLHDHKLLQRDERKPMHSESANASPTGENSRSA